MKNASEKALRVFAIINFSASGLLFFSLILTLFALNDHKVLNPALIASPIIRITFLVLMGIGFLKKHKFLGYILGNIYAGSSILLLIIFNFFKIHILRYMIYNAYLPYISSYINMNLISWFYPIILLVFLNAELRKHFYNTNEELTTPEV